MPLVMTLITFLVLRNSKSSLTASFSCFCSWIRLAADVRIIGGRLPVFSGTASSCGVFCVLGEFASLQFFLSGAKKLMVATTVEGVSTAADDTVVPAFMEFRAASSVLYLFRLRTSLNPSSCVAGDFCV
jgi:hypothetical protein